MTRAQAIATANAMCESRTRWESRLGWLMLLRAAGVPWPLLTKR